MTWHFETSPPMSTYLVAVVIGNLTSVERTVAPANSTAGAAAAPAPRRVSVWGPPGRVANLEFAADVAAKVLPAFEAAFGVPYALPKLDLVAIPDFSAGAMENWGLITYRETALLTSPTSSATDLRHVTTVVAHEMAHQASWQGVGAGRMLPCRGTLGRRRGVVAWSCAHALAALVCSTFFFLFLCNASLARPALTSPSPTSPSCACSGLATW